MTQFRDSSRRSFVTRGLATGGALLASGGLSAAAQTRSAGAREPRTAAARFRQMLEGSEVLRCPVIFDAVSAKITEELGFPAIYAGGQTVSASMYGIGDFGSLTTTELIEFAGRIAGIVDTPVVGDADDGGGNPLNVYRTIQGYERLGVASVMIEDMYGTKHLPGLSEGPMTPIPEFVEKIKAAVDARKGELVLIARSDALSAKEPFEKGLERLAAYAEAGADVVFLAGGKIRRTPELREATGRPVMTVTMPTDPDSAPGVLEASGVKIACYAYQVMAVAIGAVQRALRDIHETGRIQSYEQLAVSSEDYRKILGTDGAVMVRDRELDDEFLRRAREQGVFQASALAIQALPVDSGWLRDPAFREATPASVIARLESGETGRPGGSSAERTQQFKDLMRKNVQKLRSAGVPIALGGDTGIPTRFVGYNEHLELQAMVAVGMSPLEAISAGTSVAAAILRLQDLGSLTPGKSADFIVLDGNPLESIVNTTRIASVYRDGKPVDRDSLKAGWMR